MRRFASLAFVALALSLNVTRASAVQPDEVLSDTVLESRARALSKELRCMICQNQSIDDSDAPLARDLRLLVRERLQAGDTDKQVVDFLTARYGEFVLLRPRFSPHTAILWFTPAGLFLLAIVGVALARRRRGDSEEDLTPEEQARLAEIAQHPEG
ncbi:MAG: cytochrome c-type biogenesis protein CcmH [Alphaproteobacteria bacterium]|nr:MAG: cytochrome c-type biogenesis protein CcmH [Alphaproteobacteria bacterium]